MGEAAERFFPLLTLCLEAEAKQGRAQCRVTVQLGSSGTESTSCSCAPLRRGFCPAAPVQKSSPSCAASLPGCRRLSVGLGTGPKTLAAPVLLQDIKAQNAAGGHVPVKHSSAPAGLAGAARSRWHNRPAGRARVSPGCSPGANIENMLNIPEKCIFRGRVVPSHCVRRDDIIPVRGFFSGDFIS